MQVPPRQVRQADLRTVALVGHAGTGKTTLAEALAAASGAIARPGRVEDGTTVSDWQPEEHRRGSSSSLSVLPIMWKGFKLNVLDTPGDPDFEGEATAALSVADLAVFVVSAVDGVEAQHEVLWRLCQEAGKPRMVFVNELDRDRASFERTLDDLRDRFGAGLAPLELPIGAESGVMGVVDLLTDQAHVVVDGRTQLAALPTEMEHMEHEVHDALVEGIVVSDDGLLERYLSGDVPPTEELEAALARGVDDAEVFPVACGSAATGVGVEHLADLICEIGPSPIDRPPTTVEAAGLSVDVPPDPQGPPLLLVFKTIVDPYLGHLSVFKVISGTIRPGSHLVNSRTGKEERLQHVFAIRGSTHLDVTEVVAGDVAVVSKLTGTRTGDTLAPRDQPVVVPPPRWPEPGVAVAVRPTVEADEDKLATALHKLSDEDPALVVERDESGQTVLRCVGSSHLSVVLDRLEQRYGVPVVRDAVQIPYRETVAQTAEGEGRYKKQSGGHGQFGVVRLRVEPLDRGAGFEFVDAVVGGAIPRQYIPAVERGVLEAMAEGGVSGHPVVDVRVTCLDGKHHPVDSSEMSFKVAGRLAMKEAVAAASPVLLEPISRLEVVVPVELQGEVLGDISSRRGKVHGSQVGADPRTTTIVASVPTSELADYALSLRSRTGGRGRFHVEHEGYEPAPLAVR